MEKKERAKASIPIGLFKNNNYKNFIKKYKFYYFYMKILSKHQILKKWKEIFIGVQNTLNSEKDYTETIDLRFNKKIHGDNF